MDEHSRYIIARAIEKAHGNQTRAAESLRLQRTYLARLIKQQRDRQEGQAEEGAGSQEA
jgi:DNA-binding NtrC family response regulator